MPMVFIPREILEGETRVAATPETVKRMVKLGLEVSVEAGAGAGSHISDADYTQAGATVGEDTAALWGAADFVAKVQPPEHNAKLDKHEVELLKEGARLASYVWSVQNAELSKRLVDQKVDVLAMEAIPRISRAQKMDALSSQSNLAGYKAVILAANALNRIMPMLVTAAGTIKPAKVVVMGAGVAGLQAIATAKRLGAIVEATDVRAAVKEQVESLGGKFIDIPVPKDAETAGGYAKELTKEQLEEQQKVVQAHLIAADVVITTALIPGKKAPLLVPAHVVEKMKDGSVIVDLAAIQGGNCELTEDGKTVVKHGVTIIGESNVPALLSTDASAVYARNVLALLSDLVDKESKEIKLDLEDEVVAGSLIIQGGEVRHAPTKEAIEKLEGAPASS
jgi:proton-translocating NAD(P)+ transhydrogenase subunit alpha